MSIPANTVLLFGKGLLLWVLGFTVSAWMGLDGVNTMMGSPAFLPSGPFTLVTHTLLYLPTAWVGICGPMVAFILVLLCIHDLLRGSRWWTAVFIWWSFINLMHVAWLAGSGGQHLISNLLFWNILLSLSASPTNVWPRFSAFWIIRSQVLLAYLVTGLHKLTGTHWVDGTAMGIVATDVAFGPAWIAELPLFAAVVTWAVLLFQLTFPIAVWWPRARTVLMLFGTAFHLGTALWMDIPEMAFAFIVGYTIWLSPAQVEHVLAWRPFRQLRQGSASAIAS